MAAPTLKARAHSGPSYTTLLDSTLRASVANLQRHLGIRADGVFGPQTRAAVVRFQRAHHLGVDGVAGRATFRALHMYYVDA
ncbi:MULTISPECIES: peptidoglycan-binding protein [Dermacoccus]|uniref:peptidoglycan-binding domain-containing protein n=1 Tax=Dermacoccus TaxID=57495 RepID=UPI000587CB19|nr:MULTISPECIES: peptidoglycan-binding domain-containing protein [Dermacoccus]TCJ90310.1 putative peptidoglycan binding protein [Dermacoccus sp. SAI-028]